MTLPIPSENLQPFRAHTPSWSLPPLTSHFSCHSFYNSVRNLDGRRLGHIPACTHVQGGGGISSISQTCTPRTPIWDPQHSSLSAVTLLQNISIGPPSSTGYGGPRSVGTRLGERPSVQSVCHFPKQDSSVPQLVVDLSCENQFMELSSSAC